MSDDDRFSTQLEGKKLKGFGAKIGEFFGHIISSTTGVGSTLSVGGVELDDERGIQAEEIIFDDKGKEIEERKKRQALMDAKRQQKQAMRAATHKKGKRGREDEREYGESREKASDREEIKRDDQPKREMDEIRDAGAVKKDPAQKDPQLDIAQGKQPLKEGQVIMETAMVRQEALQTQAIGVTPLISDVMATAAILGVGNVKHMDTTQIGAEQQQKQAEFSPAKGIADVAKMILDSVLPTQVQDIRGTNQGQEQGAPQDKGQGR